MTLVKALGAALPKPYTPLVELGDRVETRITAHAPPSLLMAARCTLARTDPPPQRHPSRSRATALRQMPWTHGVR